MRRFTCIAVTVFMVVCGGCGGSTSGVPDSGSPGGGGTPTPPPLAGAASGPATSAIGDVFTPEPVDPSEISEDANGKQVQRTVIKIVFVDTATVGEVNDLLIEFSAEIVAALSGYPALVVRIPDPGTIQALETLISDIQSRGTVASVLKSFERPAQSLPENVHEAIFGFPDPNPEFSDIWLWIDHQLAVRGAAAWSLQSLITKKPKIVILDEFGDGDPNIVLNDRVFHIEPLSGEANVGFGGPVATPLSPNNHGYGMLSIIAAEHSPLDSNLDQEDNKSQLDDHDFVTGMVPNGVEVGVVDLAIMSDAVGDIYMMQLIRDAIIDSAGPVIVNLSRGWDCDPAAGLGDPCNSQADLSMAVIDFIKTVRHIDAEKNALFVAAAGNLTLPGPSDAATQSNWNAATLIDGWIDPLSQEVTPSLSNVLVVENATDNGSPVPPFSAGCIHQRSFVGGHIAGIGRGLAWLGAPSIEPSIQIPGGGTSSATAQVSGVAAYISAVRPDLTPQDLIRVLTRTAETLPGTGTDCTSLSTNAKMVDAYAALLATDQPDRIDRQSAKSRMKLLDITDDPGQDGKPDNDFDIHDLEEWIWKLTATDLPENERYYSRYDLNGDGVAGVLGKTDRFDLDISMNPGSGTSVPFSIVDFDFLGTRISYSEDVLSDIQIVCYYANTDLYDLGGTGPLAVEIRDAELQKAKIHCDPCLLAAQATSTNKAAFGTLQATSPPVCEDPPILVGATKVTEFSGSVDIFKISAGGTIIEQLTFDPDPFNPRTAHHATWSPNRSKIAFDWNLGLKTEVYVMEADGTNQQKLTDRTAQTGFNASPTWSPDGLKLAYISKDGTLVGADIVVMNADGTEKQVMLTTIADVFELSWSPDGSRIVYTEGTRDSSDINIAEVLIEVEVDEEIWTLVNPVTLVSNGEINRHPRWSPDGLKILFVNNATVAADKNIFTIGPDGLNLQQLTGPDDPITIGGAVLQVSDQEASWSPDGTQIALVRPVIPEGTTDLEDSTQEVWLMNLDGSDLRQLTPTDLDFTVHEVSWSNW